MKSNLILIVGASGRMSRELQLLSKEKKQPYMVRSSRDRLPLDWNKIKGVIDFSTPSSSLKYLKEAQTRRIPYVCGTTGWPKSSSYLKAFKNAAKSIPIVLDSNFSLGIEVLCQAAERMAVAFQNPVVITELHHKNKKDAPSGTALKIADRVRHVSPKIAVSFHSIRLGNIPGEHRVYLSAGEDTLEFIHRAHSRRAFAEGAFHALHWLQSKRSGFYTMKDVLERKSL